jgi:hypothetical protein
MVMDANDWGMRFGMFLGGLVMALVPIGISVGILIWAWRERQRAQEEAAEDSEGVA